MSHNPSSDQLRSLTSTASVCGYANSNGQLTMPADIAAYQPTYSYPPGPHDPSAYAFATQQTYRPAVQTHPLGQSQQMPSHPHQHHPHQQEQMPPTSVRKRRASDIGDHSHGVSGVDVNAHSFASSSIMSGSQTGDSEVSVGSAQTAVAAPKKGRTNTPWTPAEEQLLKNLRDEQNSWAEIAMRFPTRTEGGVKKHWYKDMHFAAFSEDEKVELLKAIKEYDSNKWKTIGQIVGKPAKACETFAKEQWPNAKYT